jgi:hypothetical protein
MDPVRQHVKAWQAKQQARPARTLEQAMQHARWRLVTMRWQDVKFHVRRLAIAVWQALKVAGTPPYTK